VLFLVVCYKDLLDPNKPYVTLICVCDDLLVSAVQLPLEQNMAHQKAVNFFCIQRIESDLRPILTQTSKALSENHF